MTAATRGPSPTHHYQQRPGARRVLTGTPATPQPRRSGDALWDACCRGAMPAEALHPRDREDLVYALHERGWSDVEIAVHTRMTVYTTDRIRTRMGLAPNASASRTSAA